MLVVPSSTAIVPLVVGSQLYNILPLLWDYLFIWTSVMNKHKISTCLYSGGSESCTSIFDSDAYSLYQPYVVAVLWVILTLNLLRFGPAARVASKRSVNLMCLSFNSLSTLLALITRSLFDLIFL